MQQRRLRGEDGSVGGEDKRRGEDAEVGGRR